MKLLLILSALLHSSGSPAPSDDEVRRSYQDLLKRSICRGAASCDQAEVDEVSQVECAPLDRPGRIRCEFFVHVETFIGEGHLGIGWDVHLHRCTGVFQRRRGNWRMASVIGQCPPHPAGRPAP